MSGGGGKSGGGGQQLVGFRYFITIHFGICHGTLGKLRAVLFGDKVAWQGQLTKSAESKYVQIAADGLFGGERSEGGISGDMHFGFGGLDQEMYGVNPDGTSSSPRGPRMATNYRGIAVAAFEDLYIGTSPYLKDVSFEVERYWKDWYPQVAQIGADANPAHIIYECCVNDEWGLGYGTDVLDNASFRSAALKLYNEGFGISLTWSDQTSVEDFINEILSHIDADFFFDQSLGRWRLRLIRNEDAPVFPFSPSNCEVTSFTRKAMGEVVNQLYVKYVSRDTEDFLSVAIQDLASIESQGGTASTTREYRGIREESLALRVCQRDLQSISATLATVDLVTNRSAWDLTNGDVVTLSWPPYEIVNMEMRVTALTYGDSESGDIKVSLVEDVFGKVFSVFGEGATPGTGTGGPGKVTPFDNVVPWEPPYWYIVQYMGEVEIDPLLGGATPLVTTTNAAFRSVDVYTGTPDSVSDPVVYRTSGVQTPSALIDIALPKAVTSELYLTASTLTGDLSAVYLNSFAQIGTGADAELVWLSGKTATGWHILRGMLDTQPRDWPVGSRVFFISNSNFPLETSVWAMGTPITYRVVMQTGSDTTEIEKAQSVSTVVAARQGRPLLPANIRVSGELWPTFAQATDANTIEVTWSTRNRLLQTTSTMEPWDGPGIGHEPGATYTLELRQFGVVVSSLTGLKGSSATFFLDSAVSGPVQMTLYAERDGLRSYQTFDHQLEIAVAEAPAAWPAVSFPGRRLALVGDSITHQNTLHVDGTNGRYEQYGFSVVGYWPIAAQILNHPLELEPGIQRDLNGRKQGLNVAIAGSRVMNWWSPHYDNQDDGVFDKGPMYVALKNINAFDVVVMMGGTNDLSFNRTTSQVLADIKRAASELASRGKWVFLMTITARTTDLLAGYTAAQQAAIRDRIAQVNAGIKSWVEKTQPANIWLVDAFAAVVGPNGVDPAGRVSSLTDPDAPSTLGNYRADDPGMVYMPDGLHPGSAGARAIAKALAGVMRSAGIPDRVPGTIGPITLGENLLPNSTFESTSTRPAGGKSSVLGRALGLGPARIDITHAAGNDSYSNVGLGYTFGPMPDYWFFYRASNLDNESNSNFGAYAWEALSNDFPVLKEYMAESTWIDGCARTSVVTVDGKRALRIDFRTPVTGNKNEAFVLRAFIPRGQHGAWDDYNDGNILVPNTVYSPGDRLSAEAEVRFSNVHGLHTAVMNLEFQSVDVAATAGGDYTTAGSVISGASNSMNFWPPSILDTMRVPTGDITLQMHTPIVTAPTPAPTENHQFARLNFQFACDASTQPASVTVIIIEPTVNKASALVMPPEIPDEHGLGQELGLYLGGIPV